MVQYAMLLQLNGMYFSWDPDRFADVVASLHLATPFVAYPGTTRVKSDGTNVQLSLDGRRTSMTNQDLADILTNEMANQPPSGMEP